MPLTRRFLAVIYSALLAVLFAQAQSTNSAICVPRFSLTPPWLGADAAYSIPLPDGRDVWIFGDTLYGNHRVIVGDNPQMVRNTIGLSTCQRRIDRTKSGRLMTVVVRLGHPHQLPCLPRDRRTRISPWSHFTSAFSPDRRNA